MSSPTRVGRPEADHGLADGTSFSSMTFCEHRLRIVEELARGLALLLVLEDRRDSGPCSSQVWKNGVQSM